MVVLGCRVEWSSEADENESGYSRYRSPCRLIRRQGLASAVVEPKALKSATVEGGTKRRPMARRCVRLARAPQRRATEQAALARRTHRSKPPPLRSWAAGRNGGASGFRSVAEDVRRGFYDRLVLLALVVI